MTWLAVPVAGFAIYVGIMAAAAYRASRRRARACVTCGRVTCPGCAYRAPTGGSGL